MITEIKELLTGEILRQLHRKALINLRDKSNVYIEIRLVWNNNMIPKPEKYYNLTQRTNFDLNVSFRPSMSLQ